MPATACRIVRRSELTPGSIIVMQAGTIKRIHVNQHVIRRNNTTGERNNVITVQWRNKSYPVENAEIRGPAKAVYSPDKPLSCGARVWVETTSEVVVTC
jgi:hypothetical protein